MSGWRSISNKPDIRSLWILVTGMVMLQCGVIGPPIAPEDVGVAPIIERQKKREADRSGATDQGTPHRRGQAGTMPENNVIAEPTEDLPEPPLKSMGTR